MGDSNWMPTRQWYVARFVVKKSGHKNHICYCEIGLYVQYKDAILSSIGSIIRKNYVIA